MAFTKINAAGIGTTERVTVDGLTVINNLSVGGTVSIAGTLTYEDVTNVDAVGLITARGGIVVGSGITLSQDGNIFTTGISTFGGDVQVPDKIIHAGDTDTAIRFPGNDQISFETGGTQHMIIGTGGAIAITDTIQHTGDTNTKIRFPANDTITAETGGSERLRITSAGLVGIGTNNPDSLLTVGASANPSIAFKDYTNNARAAITCGALGQLVFQTDIDNGSANSDFVFRADGSTETSEIIRFKNTGNVGFGTDNPRTKLHVHSAGSGFNYGTVGNLIVEDSTDSTIQILAPSTHSSLIHFGDESNGMVGRVGYAHTDNTMRFTTFNSERARINSSGLLLINHTTPRYDNLLQIEGTGGESEISVIRNSNNGSGAGLMLGKSRTSSVGGNTIVQDGDKLGVISFGGADGTDLASLGAQITGEVDGTPGANDMPGRIVFKTTADGASSTTERLRIGSNGFLTVTTTGQGSGIRLVDSSTSSGSPNLEIISKRSDSNNNTAFSSNIFLGKNRTDQKVTSGIRLGTINFGGNHTDGTETNISYSASIQGIASDSFDSKSDMPTDLIFTTGTSGTDRDGELAGQSNVGTERMRINSAGIVTKPYTPSFSAKGSTDAIVAQSPLPFDSTGGINHNNGNHYNTTTYKFTCPVDGYYYVTCHVVPTNYDVGNNVELYVADNSGSRHFLDRKVKTTNYASNNFSVGGSRIIYKASGSTLWVEFNGIAGSPTLEGSSHFGITLIA